MVLKKTTDYLDSLINYERKGLPHKSRTFKLTRIKKFLKLLKNPQRKFPVIHIAGSKGKGSTVAFTAYILREAGMRVGLYTSPHLFDRTERIRVLNPNSSKKKRSQDFEGSISKAKLNTTVLDILKQMSKENLIVRNQMSFFEFFTGVAFFYFAQQKVDVAVVEVGLGGRLDATNVVDGDICGITAIGLEHTKQLGNHLFQIAREKAAIIKKTTKAVVVSPQKKEVLNVIFKRSREFKIPVLISKRNLIKSTPLLGAHQIVNASLAATMVQCFLLKGFKDLEKHILNGIKATQWPARFEILKRNPVVVIDGAHTKESAQNLSKTLKDIFPGKDVILILGVSEDKDIKGICLGLKNIAKEIILTRSSHPRAFAFEKQFSKEIFGKTKITFKLNAKKALASALKISKKKDIVLTAGSIFLAAEIRKQLVKR